MDRSCACTLLALALILPSQAAAQTTTRVNLTATGGQASGGVTNYDARASDSGQFVVFSSVDSTLVPGDTNGAADIFVRDRIAGTTIRVNVTSAGVQANAGTDSRSPVISRDGNFVAFISTATLVPELNPFFSGPRVFRRQLPNGPTTLVSRTTTGLPAFVEGETAISDDGLSVAFVSREINVVPGDTNNLNDVFVRDLQNNFTELVSQRINGQGTIGDGFIFRVGISGSGRFVAFEGFDPDIVVNDTNGQSDVFLFDRLFETMVRVSETGGSGQLDAPSRFEDINQAGDVVVFTTAAAALPGDTNGVNDVYIKTVPTGNVNRASIMAAAGQAAQANGPSGRARISSNGQLILFESLATNLVAGDTNDVQDVFLHIRGALFTTSRVNLGAGGVQANRQSAAVGVSFDGSVITFESDATNLIATDSNGLTDLFSRTGPANTRLTLSTGGLQLDTPGFAPSSDPTVSADGRFVGFASEAGNLVADDHNSDESPFIRDTIANGTGNATTLVPLLPFLPVSLADNVSELAISLDGRTLSFEAAYDFPDDNIDTVLIHDRLAGATQTASGLFEERRPSPSAGGRYIVFDSSGADLVAGDVNGERDVFVFDRETNSTSLVSVGQGGVQGNDFSNAGVISGTGRFVAFQSPATNLVPGDTNDASDVFVRDLLLGVTSRVSVSSGGGQANGASGSPAISFDGRFVAFQSNAGNIASPVAAQQVYLHDRLNGTTIRVSNLPGGGPGPVPSRNPSISQNGRFVAFVSQARLVAVDTNDFDDIYVFDRTSGQVVRASVSSAGAQGQPPPPGQFAPAPVTTRPSITADGTAVVFQSEYTNLVAGDTNGVADIFMRTLGLGSDTAVIDPAFLTDFGLAPGTLDGGPFADPDNDGLSNLEEQELGTHPRGLVTRFLAEGATGFFDARIALLNPERAARRVLVRFLREGGAPPISRLLTLPARRRATIDVKSIPGLEDISFSTLVESDGEIVVDRQMTWDGTGYGSHAETASPRPGQEWFLAEGATHSDFQLFYLLQNPHPFQTATVRIRYLRPATASGTPAATLEKDYVVGPNARRTIFVNLEEFPAGSGNRLLAATDVSAAINVIDGPPIIVERAMYLNRNGQLFTAGHDSAGVTSGDSQWFLAEGATGSLFDMFVLIANPNTTEDAIVDVTYLREGLPPLDKTYIVAAGSRRTIFVDVEQFPDNSGNAALADAGAVSVILRQRNGRDIVVERSMWFPGPTSATWTEAHNSPGTVESGTRWAFAEGEVGGPTGTQTFILLANTESTITASVVITLLFENGTSTVAAFILQPQSRRTVGLPADPVFDFERLFSPAELAAGIRFGAIIESQNLSSGGQGARIVVERAMYSSPGAGFFLAGTDAVATKLP